MAAQPDPAEHRLHLSEVLATVLDRRVGRLTGNAGRAVSTTHAVSIFAVIATLSYAAFFMTYDLAAFGGLVAFNMGMVLVYAATVLLARLGRQLGAALLLMSGAIVQLVMATAYVGWESGLHLYMLLGGQLVFMVYTERQRPLRWLYALLALAGFLVCQFRLPSSSAVVELPTVVLNALFSINALATASLLFILAAVAHFRAEQARSAAAENAARAEYLANTDALTGLATRRPVMERLEALSGPEGPAYSLAIADLDRFKVINDTHGHTCGDLVLADVGARLRGCLRVTDSVGRWGGEEFIFVLPGASIADAMVMMERVRTTVRGTPVSCGDHEHTITVSIGLTDGQYDGSPHLAIRRADDALYDAKSGGRDRVAVLRSEGDTDAPEPPARSGTRRSRTP